VLLPGAVIVSWDVIERVKEIILMYLRLAKVDSIYHQKAAKIKK
jgi:hypothetical protein